MPIFAKQGEYEPCGIFTTKHFILIILALQKLLKIVKLR